MNDDYIKSVASLDPVTLDELMEQYGQDVWNFAHLLTRNRSMADDIAQDVFLQAYRHAETFRGEASVKTWLLKITRNISYNYRNTAFFRKVLLVDVMASKESSHSAEQSFLEEEATNDIWRQVFQLSIKYREVIVLHAKHQLSLQEIALILKIPVGTVKSRLFGARKRLSSLLKEEFLYGSSI
ncbi:RNA polymerase sigma factor [Cohnella sp. WQ 127256]|uniref:RNA polymerase sigma factor n=1 Tax=Cohnella sp. WQ 127256 TaxID=2938790 RepID=UPI002118BF02|nr:sigma-70 family RNA polymerase sigma factor [Cohnella sp. WQ 127256]